MGFAWGKRVGEDREDGGDGGDGERGKTLDLGAGAKTMSTIPDAKSY